MQQESPSEGRQVARQLQYSPRGSRASRRKEVVGTSMEYGFDVGQYSVSSGDTEIDLGRHAGMSKSLQSPMAMPLGDITNRPVRVELEMTTGRR